MPSTVIHDLDYDAARRTLYVRFVDGDVYAYFDVPAPVVTAFTVAPSRGRYFAYNVRGRYAYRKLRDGEDGPEAGPRPSPRGGPGAPQLVA